MIWISLGENCLPDDVLKRHGLKSFSTPFSSARSNIDYAIQADAERFQCLLDKNKIKRHPMGSKSVLRNESYSCSEGVFDQMVSRGFEFTHHDIFENAQAFDSYERKIARWNDLKRSDDDVTFLYHHRVTGPSSTAIVRKKVRSFLKQFDPGAKRSLCIILVQNLVNERSISLDFDKNTLIATVNAPIKWEGDDSNVLFGRIDDDLIAPALDAAKEHWEYRKSRKSTTRTLRDLFWKNR